MAAFVKSVERISLSVAGNSGTLTTASVALTKGQDVAKCAVVGVTARMTASSFDSRANNLHAVRVFDNAGTPTAEVSKWASNVNAPAVVEAAIVEFTSGVTVQSGSVNLTGTSVTANITTVDTDNAVIFFNSRNTGSSGDDFNDMFIRSDFASASQIRFTRIASGVPDHLIYWWVVESDGTDFQVEYIQASAAASAQGPTNLTLSNPVTLGSSFIVPSYQSSESADDLRDAIFNMALTGTSTLTWYRNHGSTPVAAATLSAFVVRSNSAGCAVQRFATDVDGQLTTNQTITAVDLDEAAILSGHHVGVGDWPIDSSTDGQDTIDHQSAIKPTSTTNVQIQRFADTTIPGSNNNVRYEVVEFKIAGVGPPAQSVAVGIVSETDSVLAVTPELGGAPQTVAVGLVSETDTVLAVAPVAGAVSVPVGVVAETDTVLAVTPITGGAPQAIPVGLVAETDSVEPVKPVPGAVSVPVGIVSETDTVLPVTPLPGAVAVSVGIVSELNQIAPVFPVVEGGPQTVLILNVNETDTVFPVTPRIGPDVEPPVAGLPSEVRKPNRKTRRYILPDNRVFTDPDRALFELRELLKKAGSPAQPISDGGFATPESQDASLSQGGPPSDTLPDVPVSSDMMREAVADLPLLIRGLGAEAQSLDPQLISVLFERIDDEEAAILLL